MKNDKWQWLKELVIISSIMFIIRYSLINWYVIPTGSMLPTIHLGDHVLVNNLSYGFIPPFFDKQVASWAEPERGDIVLFKSPKEGVTFVKRVVGIENDKVQFIRGRLQINGNLMDEQLVHDRQSLNDLGQNVDDKNLFWRKGLNKNGHYVLRLTSENQAFAHYATESDTTIWNVPSGHIMVVGDNLDGSNDSRFWGFIETKRVYGKAFRILYSTIPDSGFPPKFRWNRFFSKLE